MNVSLCTISFRHQLISFADMVSFAQRQGFDGIELWGIHAKTMFDCERDYAEGALRQLRQQGMDISMLSDYLDISPNGDFRRTTEKCLQLIQLADWLGVSRIRTFAGQRPSARVSLPDREIYVHQLNRLCELCRQHGKRLVVETHPNTLADSLGSTLMLLEETAHEALKINLDFLHLWEAGDDPIESYRKLEPWVEHFHLKNISSAAHLGVFQPDNVYAAGGSREGIVPLRSGAVDYRPILQTIRASEHYASLEWFGPSPLLALGPELEWVRAQTADLPSAVR